MEVTVKQIECKRCGHVWTPRKTPVRLCARCRSSYWDVPRTRECYPGSFGRPKENTPSSTESPCQPRN